MNNPNPLALSLRHTFCWIWDRNRKYPSITVGKKTFRVHRLSWEMKNGRPLEEGMLACHHCDNPSCFNPDHIFEGTHKQNMQDAAKKGRMHGSRSKNEEEIKFVGAATFFHFYPNGRIPKYE